MPENKFLVVVGGPTASGKTKVAIELARHFNTHIISTDSRQFYREMSIGTAKPSPEELAQAPHHFINSLSIHETYDVGKFEADALQLLDELFETHQVVVVAGGSGLFIRALTEGLDDLPVVPESVSERVRAEYSQHGLKWLQEHRGKRILRRCHLASLQLWLYGRPPHLASQLWLEEDPGTQAQTAAFSHRPRFTLRGMTTLRAFRRAVTLGAGATHTLGASLQWVLWCSGSLSAAPTHAVSH